MLFFHLFYPRGWLQGIERFLWELVMSSFQSLSIHSSSQDANSALRRVHFSRFKCKTYSHQPDSYRTLWRLLPLTFVPGLLSPPPDLAGALPVPSPSCCRAGIWGAEWANQGKTCFPSPPALEFPAAGPEWERQKVAVLSVCFTGVWKVSGLFCRKTTLGVPSFILN